MLCNSSSLEKSCSPLFSVLRIFIIGLKEGGLHLLTWSWIKIRSIWCRGLSNSKGSEAACLQIWRGRGSAFKSEGERGGLPSNLKGKPRGSAFKSEGERGGLPSNLKGKGVCLQIWRWARRPAFKSEGEGGLPSNLKGSEAACLQIWRGRESAFKSEGERGGLPSNLKGKGVCLQIWRGARRPAFKSEGEGGLPSNLKGKLRGSAAND